MYMDPFNPDFGFRPMPGRGPVNPYGLPRCVALRGFFFANEDSPLRVP
jgi:hypothetical protein